jgi:hypothetical protein
LANIASYEEGLSVRVGALTGMVWGIVSAAIFVTYGAVSLGAVPSWLMPFLWLPWTAAGMATTIGMWRVHAITLRRPHSPWRSFAFSLAFAALFFVALMGLHLLGLGKGAFPYMLVVNGLAAFLIVALASRQRGRLAAAPMLVAGLLIIAGAFALGATHLSQMGMAFASAALVGTSFVGASLVSFVRG